MKTIILVRHAKAESPAFDDDFSRALQPEGIADAKKLSETIKKIKLVPNKIISSTAKRAMQTAKIYSEQFNITKIEAWSEFYYGVTTQEFVEKIAQTEETANTLMIFGHNPTIHYLIDNMCKYFNNNTPTCATAVIEFEVESWNQVEPRIGKLKYHLTPN